MKKLFSTYLFSFLAFFLLATIAPLSGSNDAFADEADCILILTPANNAECVAESVTTGSIQGECVFTDTTTPCRWDGISVASADNNAFVNTLCNVLRLVTGNGGKAFAAFAIISLGIGFFTGKVSWGLMIGVAAGIAAMFGAPTIVAAISGQGSFNCGVGNETGRLGD